MPSTLLFSWTDVVLLALVCIFTFAGWRNGIVKMGYRLFSFVAGIVLAWFLYPVLADYLKTTVLYDYLVEALGGQTAASANTALLPAFLQENLEREGSTFTHGIAGYFAQLILNIISFISVVIASKLVLMLLGQVLNFFANLPFIGFFNRLAGMVLGLLEGLLISCLLLGVIYAVVPLRDNAYLSYAIEQSVATRILYLNNPLIRLVLPETQLNTTIRIEMDPTTVQKYSEIL